MEFIRISSAAHSLFKPAITLYEKSFPLHEQRSYVSQCEVLENGEYHFAAICEEAGFAGLLLYWETMDYIYIEHFCIEPALRGQNLGGKALQKLGEIGKPVILEIDPPVDAISIRRRNFYTRAGYCENPFAHIHPPYSAGRPGHALVVMSSPNALAAAAYDRFNEYLKNVVMRYR